MPRNSPIRTTSVAALLAFGVLAVAVALAPTARAKGLKLTFVPCSLPVESDRLLLRRLLQNLISNAIKYTPRGRVLVGCRRHGQSLQIGVYDTGVGVPILKRGEIFKEFHRLEQGARIARGLGLGAALTPGVAGRGEEGGRVRAVSLAHGQCTFRASGSAAAVKDRACWPSRSLVSQPDCVAARCSCETAASRSSRP